MNKAFEGIKTVYLDFDGTLHNTIRIYGDALRKGYDFLVQEGYKESRHISDEEGFQAIMVGIGTVLADDPRLNTRIEGERSPIRVILDTSLRIPENARMLSLEDGETWIFTTNRAPKPKFEALSKRDRVRVIEVKKNQRDGVDLREVMDYLAREGIASVLLEGGPNVTFSMLDEGLIHKVALFVAPRIIGGRHAKSLVEGEGVAKLSEAYELIDMTVEKVGEDLLIKGYTEEGAENVYGNY